MNWTLIVIINIKLALGAETRAEADFVLFSVTVFIATVPFDPVLSKQ